MLRYLAVCLLFSCFCCGYAKTTKDWKSRIIYQLLTDRFSREGDAPGSQCDTLREYCGGTFRGIKQRLDYIQSLGANAIWISPFVENTDKGYHGYWAKNIYSVNPFFGTREELQDLVKACHEKDIWVMMDVVANHMGVPEGNAFNFTDFVPFNETWHYHDFCEITDWANQTQVEICRLAALPDLNETEPIVRSLLLQWIEDITSLYGFDGYRVDTVVEMPKSFWHDFSRRVEDTYMLGEANNGDRACYLGAYQGPLPALLNFPQYWALRRAFVELQPMTEITQSLREQRRCFLDTSVLGLFVDNHDFPRFLHLQDDTVLLANALAYVMFGEGIPIIYYGTEQSFHGGNDPENRESLWPYYSNTSSLYRLIQSYSDVRQRAGVNFADRNQVELYVDTDSLVFARGERAEFLVILSNVGRYRSVNKTITGLNRYPSGPEFVNVFNDCDYLTVENGSATIYLPDGMPRIYRQRTRMQVPVQPIISGSQNATSLGLFLAMLTGSKK